MGEKQDWSRKYLYFYLAGLILLISFGCATCAGLQKIWGEDAPAGQRLSRTEALQPTEKTKKRKFGKPFRYEEKIGGFLDYAEELLGREDYEGVIAESQKILDLTGENSPEDEALFVLGLAYAHYGNAKRDYEKSLDYFKELVSNHPKSPMVERAKIWIGVLEILEKMKQVDIELEKKKKEWTE